MIFGLVNIQCKPTPQIWVGEPVLTPPGGEEITGSDSGVMFTGSDSGDGFTGSN